MDQIKYYSTNLQSPESGFGEALLKGLAPDGGLYMPERIPSISLDEMAAFSEMEYHEIAFKVLDKFLGETIPDEKLAAMTRAAYNFSVPLEQVYDNKYVMRLDQGPTASFKDFAARMMAQLMQYFIEKENRNLLILTATSGDTGSAMANAFYGLDNINVCVLFPETEVTERQRKQMTTLRDNIQILALDGKFDDCQAVVKEAFNDRELDYLNLSSANSINIGRLLPQAVYYFWAYSRLCDARKGEEIVFSVPSGNFGDLMGGIIARHMGLPVKKFVVATNANDEVPVYFASGHYKAIVPSRACISSAMNVGHPSNMARIVALYGGNMNPDGKILKAPGLGEMKSDIFAVSIDDHTTRETMKAVFEAYNVILEPHGAVGWKGLIKFLDAGEVEPARQTCVCLETAHPA
ncbi:threonine synthase, partial [bacterium]|nr:threonine synthase [bacterium]